MKIKRTHLRSKRSYNESIQEEYALIKSASIASSKAIRSSTALGLTIKVIEDNKIISINPDNTRNVIRTIAKAKIDTSRISKGMVFVRK